MAPPTRIGLAGLAVMGQNLALNIAEKGFPISVYNRTTSKVDETVERAKREGDLPLYGFHDPESFVNSIQKPRVIIMLVKAGAPVDDTIKTLSVYMEKGDCIIDGGNEWYENTERREKEMNAKGLLYLGMGVSGGEEGARHGPSLMPGGSFDAYKNIEDILLKVAAQVPDSGPCVTYVGKGGSGNFVKMVHNGIEYGDMQLIAEAYDVLKSVGKLSNEELKEVFAEWNKGELLSFLIEITADIFGIKDDKDEGHLVDKVLDKTGMKGTGKWTVQQAADLSVAAPTIAASLDSRFLSGLKEERVEASKVFKAGGIDNIFVDQEVDKKKLIDDVRQALYASKICSYAQGMNLIRAKSVEKGWDLKLGELARIWKGGCIIRAIFLDRIKKAYDRNPNLANLLIDPEFSKEMIERQSAWRRVVCLAINSGISTPGMSTSLAYFDSYRRERLPANLVQAQRDYFGAHTYERIDISGAFHTEWFKLAKQSKI
ncbi:6-phosphogluconate dehydrogenase, decarboxylating 1-like [Amaranthus tricolor]|uniref:6-phosphogluconate dehydrogenase, decarboxylating 1-like n=1 Tax=Amaranthus tricolor TaxID=29722 RepID=UPI002586DD94|nr:6-phosphogluconate dehydrogenase, decarboxylating 1-like [Amaranthus tricolor]XP_057530918.1 6-phosphogluconate dehydrogenase, decarboxylating 1-like [Amaranthus tricolor]